MPPRTWCLLISLILLGILRCESDPDQRCDLAVVIFHYDGGSPTGAQYRSMIGMTFGSAKKFNKNVCTFVLTDSTTDVSDVPGAEKVEAFEIPENAKELARNPPFRDIPGGFNRQLGLALVCATPLKLEAQLKFIEDHPEFEGRTNIMFLDSDILIGKSVGPMFKKPFSVAVTPQDRDSDNHAINAGMVAVHKDGLAGAKAFFRLTIESWKEISAEHEGKPFYFGDQLALKRAVDKLTCNKLKWIGTAPSTALFPYTEAQIRVAFLPAVHWNCKAVFGGGCDKSTAVYHFSVMRKLKMPKVWKLFSKNKDKEALAMAGMRQKTSRKIPKYQERVFKNDCGAKALAESL